jgi:hypothetical protein
MSAFRIALRQVIRPGLKRAGQETDMGHWFHDAFPPQAQGLIHQCTDNVYS